MPSAGCPGVAGGRRTGALRLGPPVQVRSWRAFVTFVVPPAILGSFHVQVVSLDPAGPGGFGATNDVEPSAR